MTRLALTDTGKEAIIKMSDGIPGALTVCVEIFKEGDAIDPDGLGAWGAILYLDTFGIYGSRIWMLYKDVCGQRLVETMAMLRACQMGIISEDELNVAIDGGHNLDADDVLKRLRQQLPTFGKQTDDSDNNESM